MGRRCHLGLDHAAMRTLTRRTGTISTVGRGARTLWALLSAVRASVAESKSELDDERDLALLPSSTALTRDQLCACSASCFFCSRSRRAATSGATMAPPRSPPSHLLFAVDSHKGAVHTAVYNTGSSYILTGGADRQVRLTNAKTGAEIKSYGGHGYEVLGLAWCVPSLSFLCLSSFSGRAYL